MSTANWHVSQEAKERCSIRVSGSRLQIASVGITCLVITAAGRNRAVRAHSVRTALIFVRSTTGVSRVLRTVRWRVSANECSEATGS